MPPFERWRNYRGMEEATLSVFAEARRTGPGVALQIDHAHRELEFNLVVSGRGTYFLEHGQHDLVPGTLVWLLPGQSHRLIRSPDLDMWVVTIAPDEIEPALFEDISHQPCRVLSTPDALALDRLLSHLSQDSDEPRLYRAGLDYVLRSAWRATATSAGPARKPLHPAVIRAISILRSNADTPTSAKLAKMCGVTQDYLGQLLMEHTGRGFVEWRNRTRLERFHIIYPQSGDLLNAALDAGFGSYTQFHRVFCEIIGTTPGEWAKSGAQAKAVALPSSFSDISGSDAESTRMVWYALSEAVHPAASRWFTPAFATNFQRFPATTERIRAIDSGVATYAALRALEDGLVGQLRATDPARAEDLARAFARNDVFECYRGTLGLYVADPGDLAHFVAVYLAFASAAATFAPVPSGERYERVFAQTRFAMTASGAFAKASPDERRLAAAALITKAWCLRSAMVGSRASGNDATAVRVADAAHATAQATLGLDVRGLELDALTAPQALAS